MINFVKERMYNIYKNGHQQPGIVGFLYNEESDVHDKEAYLMAAYPSSEGFELKLAYERTL